LLAGGATAQAAVRRSIDESIDRDRPVPARSATCGWSSRSDSDIQRGARPPNYAYERAFEVAHSPT
jgi:hypothetical protein